MCIVSSAFVGCCEDYKSYTSFTSSQNYNSLSSYSYLLVAIAYFVSFVKSLNI
jgi:hypothetical protein